MKRAIICFNCGKLKKESESYWVKVKDYKNMGQDTILKIDNVQLKEVLKVKICSRCAKLAGYKVKAKKKTPGSPSKTGAKVPLSSG